MGLPIDPGHVRLLVQAMVAACGATASAGAEPMRIARGGAGARTSRHGDPEKTRGKWYLWGQFTMRNGEFTKKNGTTFVITKKQ